MHGVGRSPCLLGAQVPRVTVGLTRPSPFQVTEVVMIYDAEKQRPRGKGRSSLSLSLSTPSDGKLSRCQTRSGAGVAMASGTG